MDVHVSPEGWLSFQGRRLRCALGRGGVRAEKREGDGATPAGAFPFRRVLYRADRLAQPVTRLPAGRIMEDDGWCDDPSDPHYNRQIRLPFPARHERLWRDDRLYDVIAVLGYNDSPPIAELGSAIFLHVARPDYGATDGCVAVELSDLLALLVAIGPADRLVIEAPRS